MRTYIVSVSRAGYRVSIAHNVIWRSRRKIREVTAVLFTKYFGGLKPSTLWKIGNSEAMAFDKRGNKISVEQYHHYESYRAGSTLMARPLCPMVIKKEVA